jgi:hypothetical protein
MREIRVRLHESDECRKMTRKQIFSHIKGIYKVKFKGKYKDIQPELSKSQRDILNALDIKIVYWHTYNFLGDLRYYIYPL